jgi:hypothetical protein
MKNYPDSDYALNKFSAGIVYRFADQIIEVTLADYLAENPGKTEADFLMLKALSDADYLERANCENRQTYKKIPLDGVDLLGICSYPSFEMVSDIADQARELAEARQFRLKQASVVLDKLTVIQRRRFLWHWVDGFTTREIADMEGVNQSKIMKSLAGAEKKIKKFLANT